MGPAVGVYVCVYRHRDNRVYNNVGVRLLDSADVCDCLMVSCPGCHFPCPRCSSPKCGAECRNNRCWYYTEAVIEGSRTKMVNDVLTKDRTNTLTDGVRDLQIRSNVKPN